MDRLRQHLFTLGLGYFLLAWLQSTELTPSDLFWCLLLLLVLRVCISRLVAFLWLLLYSLQLLHTSRLLRHLHWLWCFRPNSWPPSRHNILRRSNCCLARLNVIHIHCWSAALFLLTRGSLVFPLFLIAVSSVLVVACSARVSGRSKPLETAAH